MLSNIDKWIEVCGGNKYAATRVFIRAVRSLAKKYNYLILDSEAISWLLTGEKPKIIEWNAKYGRRKLASHLNYMDDLMTSVDDDTIKDAVRDSVAQSLEQHHLIYVWKGSLDEYRASRVRVLTRMIWYNLQEHSL